jgi:alkaline phosphatase D
MKSAIYILAALVCLTMARVACAKVEILCGPMIGHVTDNNVRVWMQLSTACEVKIQPVDADTQRPMGEVSEDVDRYPFIFDAPVNGLEPDHNYRLDVIIDDQPCQLAPPLNVHTAPAVGDAVNFKIAFGSCINQNLSGKMPIFKAVANQTPLAFLFLGNNGYLPANIDAFPTKYKEARAFIWNFHRSIRNLPDLQNLLRSSAIYGMWDDGDFGPPDPDKNFVFAKETRSAFQFYWANPGSGTLAVYYNFSMGDVDFFVLDDRMYRDAAHGVMLGDEQMAWLKKSLAASRASFKIIACPAPMLADYTDESWGNFKAEREEFIAWLFAHKIPGVFFLSGHRRVAELTMHSAAAKNIAQYPLYDLSSSALADAPPSDDARGMDNPARVGAACYDSNFGVLEFSGPIEKRHVNLLIRDAAGAIRVGPITLFAGQLKGAE